MQNVRVDIRRLLRVLLLAGVLPLTIAILIDLSTDLWPVLTIFGVLVILPIGSFLVSRAALDEMNRVIEEVAPLDVESEDETDEGFDAESVEPGVFEA